jgi:hypothetical protein
MAIGRTAGVSPALFVSNIFCLQVKSGRGTPAVAACALRYGTLAAWAAAT